MFKLTINETDNVTTIVIEGEINTITSKEFDETIKKVDAKHVVLDMAGMEYISSAGLRVLTAATVDFNANKRELELINVNDTVMEIFDMTGFLSILNIRK